MNEQTKYRIRRAYGIALSALIVLTGICLMAACLGIYHSGEEPYSRESVAAAFSTIAIPVWISLVMIAGGGLVALLLPCSKGKPSPEKNYRMILARLYAKKDLSDCAESLRKAICKEQRSRKYRTMAGFALLAVCSLSFLCYALNGDHFHQSDINASMMQAMWRFIPCLAVPYGFGIYAAYRNRGSLRREIDLMKQAQAGPAAPGMPKKDLRKTIFRLRCAVLLVGIVLLVYGFLSGGTADVLTKAVNICTECIGLG